MRDKAKAFVKLTQFGQTRIVEAELIIKHRHPQYHTVEIDEIYYAERIEDEYGLQSDRYKNLNVALVRKCDWDEGFGLANHKVTNEPPRGPGWFSDYS